MQTAFFKNAAARCPGAQLRLKINSNMCYFFDTKPAGVHRQPAGKTEKVMTHKLEFAVGLTCLFSVLMNAGGSHTLNVKNLSQYQAVTANSLSKPLRVGVAAQGQESQQLIAGIARQLGQYRATVRYPCSANEADVDVMASVVVRSDYSGSGWNFLINFPGFLVWAPAWNGYVYKVSHTIDIQLTRGAGGERIDAFSIPVVLDVRHAAIDRTWTEVSWFEFGVIAFVGGIVFIQYDEDVTPLLEEKTSAPIGTFVAQEIVSRLNQKGGFGTLEEAAPPSQPGAKADPAAFTVNTFKVLDYQYDSKTRKGVFSVDLSGHPFEQARGWVVANIGRICSSKEVLLEAGQESSSGGRYRVLNEAVKDGVLTVEFTAGFSD